MRIIFILFALVLSLYAKHIEAFYDVTYGIIGKIGVAKADFVIKDDNTYTISIEAKTTGFANSLSGNRREFFKSEGSVLENGVLNPKVYTHIVLRNKKKSGFVFDISKWKKVLSKKVKVIKFGEDKIAKHVTKYLDGKVTSDSVKTLKYFVKDDLLSLFFNFKTKSNDFNITKTTNFYAVGANKKDGRLEVSPMSTKLQKELFESKGGHNFIATINQPIFSSEKGELFVRLDDEGICTYAVLKDVLFFGDIKGKLVKKNVY